MKDKNRFSSQLKYLMTTTKLKNYTLAKELQYDESYISKWVTGSLLPTEKTSGKIIRDISHCVVAAADSESLEELFQNYQVDTIQDLEDAIYDNLTAEFNYVINLKESTGSEVAAKTSYYPELTLAQFMQKMRHPVLRQVKSLEVIAAMDIFSVDRNYQISIAQFQTSSNQAIHRCWPGVHFTLLLNLNTPGSQPRYNIPFLLNLLARFSTVDFQLYDCPQAQSKIIFSVKDAYCLSGMIMDKTHCLSVTATEEPKNTNAIYDRLQSLCSEEMLLVRRTSMPAMLRSNEYMQYTFSRNPRWLLSHLTEHFLPEELFDALADDYCKAHRDVDRETLRRIQKLNNNVLSNIPIRIIISETGLNDFAVTGNLDFFGDKLTLTPEQRLQCLKYAATKSEQNRTITYGILRAGRFSDPHSTPIPTLFLSDSLSYLRLNHNSSSYNISKLNLVQICEQFQEFFDAIWKDPSIVDSYINSSAELIRYTIQMIKVQISVE